MTNRQFIPITNEETEIANKEAAYIFGLLRKKYCNDNLRDLDIILNTLCFALIRHIGIHVAKEDYQGMFEIVTANLKQGLKTLEERL